MIQTWSRDGRAHGDGLVLQTIETMANIRDPAQEIVNNVDYQEDYGRRLNLRFSGIADHHRNENWENSEALVRKLIKSTLGVEKEIEVERAHRSGKWSKDPTKPRDIIIRFTKFKDRDLVLKKRNTVCSKKLIYVLMKIFALTP